LLPLLIAGGFVRPKGDTQRAERGSTAGLSGAAEDVSAPGDLEANEPSGRDSQLELSFQESTGNSTGPEVDLLPSEVLDNPGTVGVTSATMTIMGSPLREARESFEREYLKIQIRRFSGNISRTASFIGMERSALHRKLKALGIGDKRDAEE